MRSPELQLIDRLEALKIALTENQSEQEAIHLADYKKNLMSLMESSQQDIISLAPVVHKTIQSVVDTLIEAAKTNETVWDEDDELVLFLESLVGEHPEGGVVIDIVLRSFCWLLFTYPD